MITEASETFIHSAYKRSQADQVVRRLEAILTVESEVHLNYPLASKTTLKVGGPADCFVIPSEEADLSKVIKYCVQNSIPWFVLGRGSNLLIKDGGIPGVVIHLSHSNFSKLSQLNETRVRFGAGVKLKRAANFARDAGLTGLEWMEGIPGSMGGAIRMNAGAMGGETFDKLVSVRCMTPEGDVEDYEAQSIEHFYRNCPMFRDHILIHAEFECELGERSSIQELMKESNQKRWTSQPAAPSAGCTFKNPSNIPAGKLIDELGLKGSQVGQATVSDVHGNFMVNKGEASAKEFLTLIQSIQNKAKEDRGIQLQTEIQIIGEDT